MEANIKDATLLEVQTSWRDSKLKHLDLTVFVQGCCAVWVRGSGGKVEVEFPLCSSQRRKGQTCALNSAHPDKPDGGPLRRPQFLEEALGSRYSQLLRSPSNACTIVLVSPFREKRVYQNMVNACYG